ncbi:MAG TPA: glycosyltransferase [Chthoniobacterales bacterium]|jgi:spore maturation protein CgeB|nr:glycosyltransferase [Chthoniobacterales bacterium]
MKLVVFGLSITSSWGNGHATTYRALLREINRLGHQIVFLERDVPWYAAHRDLLAPTFCVVELYRDLEDLQKRFGELVRSADAVIVGSYVPEGVKLGEWVFATTRGVTAFYDIDTPVTFSKLEQADYEYLSPDLIPKYRFYFSFSGGSSLTRLERQYGSPAARALYCSADPELYYPEKIRKRWTLGYLGTYSDDRQPPMNMLLIRAALRLPMARFAVAGPGYPADIEWPSNVDRTEHLSPAQHRQFYNQQRFTLNITRVSMRRMGFSPSVRLFEAAACGTPIISDIWEGIEMFFEPGKEIILVRSTDEIVSVLRDLSDQECYEIGARARERFLRNHSARHRAIELATSLAEAGREL